MHNGWVSFQFHAFHASNGQTSHWARHGLRNLQMAAMAQRMVRMSRSKRPRTVPNDTFGNTVAVLWVQSLLTMRLNVYGIQLNISGGIAHFMCLIHFIPHMWRLSLSARNGMWCQLIMVAKCGHFSCVDGEQLQVSKSLTAFQIDEMDLLDLGFELCLRMLNPNSHLQKSACHNSSIRNRISTWATRGTMRDHSHLRLSQSSRSPGSAGSLLDHSSWGKAMAQYVFALLAISFRRCIAFEFDATLKLGWWRGTVFLLISCSPRKLSLEPHHPLKSQAVAGSKGTWIVSLMQMFFSNPGLFSKHLMSEDSLYNVAHKLSHDWMIRSRYIFWHLIL